MADVKVNVPGTGSGHLDYPVPGGSEFLLRQAFASYDGAAAAAAWLPALQLIGPDGNVAGEYVTGSTVAAGGNADVTFAPFLKGVAAAASSAGLAWMIALSGTKSVASSFAATTTFDFAGGLTTNDATVFALSTNGDGTQTPYVNAAGVYLHFMMAQLDIGAHAPAAGSIGRILSAAYGNEPFGLIQDGLFYVDGLSGNGVCNPVRQWISGLDGGGSSSPDGGTIGIRQNSTFSATTSINFASVRVNATGANIA